jgi:AcrR family transcriptional regulator
VTLVSATGSGARPMRKDAARNRELLIEAARVVFARRGLEASLDDIAKQAGVGVGTAYRHFANKLELAAAVMIEALADVREAAEQAATVEDPWLGLVGFLEAVLELQTRDRGLRELMMGVHDVDRPSDAARNMLVEPIERLLRRAQESGAVRADAAPSDLGVVLMMLCQVADVTSSASPQLWRRYLPALLGVLRTGTDPLPVPALSVAEFDAATHEHMGRTIRIGRLVGIAKSTA